MTFWYIWEYTTTHNVAIDAEDLIDCVEVNANFESKY